MSDRLRALWDFGDLDATESRFHALAAETDGPARAEVLSQLARVEGLRGRFDDADRLLVEADALARGDPAAMARIDLERGRALRSRGDVDAAAPLFERAFTAAVASGAEPLAADAAHMAALAAPDEEGMAEWTSRGVALTEASADPDARYWLGPLWNNIGWHHYEAGEHAQALDAFERALEAREADPERPAEAEIARYAVGKALRAVGRAEEAAQRLEVAVAWARAAGAPDGWFHEELAEDYATLGRAADAAEQARLALELLAEQDHRIRARHRARSPPATARNRAVAAAA